VLHQQLGAPSLKPHSDLAPRGGARRDAARRDIFRSHTKGRGAILFVHVTTEFGGISLLQDRMATELQAFFESWDKEDLLLFALLYRRRKSKKRRPVWVHPILQTREKYGEFHQLVTELRLFGSQFKDYFRLTTTQFEHVLTLVGPLIAKQDTKFRKAITPAERLAICLRCVTCTENLAQR